LAAFKTRAGVNRFAAPISSSWPHFDGYQSAAKAPEKHIDIPKINIPDSIFVFILSSFVVEKIS
jgi:hypothetical protein